MKVIIAGSRSIQLYSAVAQTVKESGFVITELVCGCADGVDRLGFVWARENRVPVHFFPAWAEQQAWAMRNRMVGEKVEYHFGVHGKRAGYMRNLAMAEYASALVLVWDGQSRGSAHMKKIAESNALTVFEKIYEH